jgi:hypothetical protein
MSPPQVLPAFEPGRVLRELVGRGAGLVQRPARSGEQHEATRAIARELRVAEDKVRETVERMLTPVTPKLKANAVELALERFDQYQASQHQAAIKGDRDAIAMCLKIEEQRADLLGTRAPASLRIDPVQLREQAEPQPTTTDRIRAALDRIAAMKASGELVAEKSVRLIAGDGSPSSGDSDPDPEPGSVS